jgi:5-methylthioadenosine/S-adenosylhomocysteine deaminase
MIARTNVLFERIHVISPETSGGVFVMSDAYVAVREGLVVYIGGNRAGAVLALAGVGYETYDGRDRLLVPALANAHGHAAMTLMRNSADDLSLHDWLYGVIFPRETRLRPQDVRNGTQLALCEMIRSGTGTAADMYFFQDTVLEAFVASGARLDLSIDAKRKDATGTLVPAPEDLERFLGIARKDGDGRVAISLLMHSVYLYPDALYRQMAEIAEDLDVGVQVHVSETKREVKECLAKHGTTPPAYLEAAGFFRTPTLAAHCVHVTLDDLEILARNDVTVVHNPSSNLKLGSGIADIHAMQRSGIRIALGTDGAASNNNLDLFHEIRLAAFLAKGTTGEAATLDAASVLRMATVNGSVGMGFPGTGVIDVGKQADLIVLNADRASMTPLGDPMSAFVYSADASCVESLLVDGRILLYKGELTTLDEERIRAEALVSARHIVSSAS